MGMTNELISARVFLRRQFPEGGRVLCAVSGGLDSMCLLHYLDTWGRSAGFESAAAHFNHGLRGPAADRDETFVRNWCAGRKIPCFVGRGDTRALAQAEGFSIEEAARKLRYAFLEETARREGFDAILTAHHADDNAETMLLNLIRGTGTAGLAGIPPVRGKICRPFLRISRDTLADYACRQGVPHVEDETNQEEFAARNILRRRVMPVLREINPRAVENMSFTAGVVERENDGMEKLGRALVQQSVETDGGVSIACSALLDVPLALAERTVLQMLAAAAGCRRDLSAAHVAAVLDLAERGAGEVELPDGLLARKTGDVLSISRREILRPAELRLNTPVSWGGYTLTLLDHRAGAGLALRQGAETITVVSCRGGERLTLPGANGARTVKRLCLDRRISLAERERLPAIYLDDRLAAVWRLGVDAEFLPEGTPCRFVQIINETEESQYEK